MSQHLYLNMNKGHSICPLSIHYVQEVKWIKNESDARWQWCLQRIVIRTLIVGHATGVMSRLLYWCRFLNSVGTCLRNWCCWTFLHELCLYARIVLLSVVLKCLNCRSCKQPVLRVAYYKIFFSVLVNGLSTIKGLSLLKQNLTYLKVKMDQTHVFLMNQAQTVLNYEQLVLIIQHITQSHIHELRLLKLHKHN